MAQKRPLPPKALNGNGDGSKSSKLENIINPLLFTSNIKERFSQAFKEGSDFNSECGLNLNNKPFPLAIIKDFISDQRFVNRLKDELLDLKFHQKSNDLFKFQQTDDLGGDETTNYLPVFRMSLFNYFREWLEEVTGAILEESGDLSCCVYKNTDLLLCHDDELEGRRIAFIYYLVPEDWKEQDGGLLDLFSVDKNGHPDSVVKSLTPASNSLIFFEVSEKSFHQVSEVLSENKTRLSLSGWFHGESLQRNPAKTIPTSIPSPAVEDDDELLLSWINSMYLNPEIVVDIESQFEENSEIQLKDFILDEKYQAMLEEVLRINTWSKEGPPNKRCYFSTQPDPSLTPTISQFYELVKSVPFFKLLTKLTGLDMAYLDLESDDDEVQERPPDFVQPPSCTTEFRKWEHGCYTLLQDQDYCGGDFVLDAFFHLGCAGWDESADGAYVSYIGKDDGSELMRVDPTPNCLSLVYCDEETSRFVKYYNHKLSKTCNQFFDISATYFEGKR